MCTGPCLQQAIVAGGCSPQGVLAQTIATGKTPAGLTQVQDLAARAFMVNSALLSGAKETQNQALSETQQLAAGRATTDPVIQRATLSLCTGGIPYDACSAAEDGSMKPGSGCLTQIWTQAGCATQGAASPTTAASLWNQYTSAPAARTAAQAIFQRMFTTDVEAQESAIKQCLGTTLIRPPVPTCIDPGVEMMIWGYTGRAPGNLPFRGRTFYPTFPAWNTGGQVLNTGLSDRVQLRFLTNCKPPTAANNLIYDLRATADDGVIVAVNEIQKINGWRDQAATTYTATNVLPLSNTQATRLGVEYYENYGQSAFQIWYGKNGTWNSFPANWLYLQQPRSAAIFAYRFYTNNLGDIRWLNPAFVPVGITQPGVPPGFTSSDGKYKGIGTVYTNGAGYLTINDNCAMPLSNIVGFAVNVRLDPVQPKPANANGLTVMEWGNLATSGVLQLQFIPGPTVAAGGTWRVAYSAPGNNQIRMSVTATNSKVPYGVWTRIVFEVNGPGKATLYVAGTATTGTWTPITPNMPTNVNIGKSTLGNTAAAFYIASLAIYDGPVPASMLAVGACE